jgi:proteic killer suppression protein
VPIRSFADKESKRIFDGFFSRRLPPSIQRRALSRLEVLDAAIELGDLAALPGLRLEQLRGDRKGQYSIRINDQWRVCFTWKDAEAHDVEITDYH